MRKLGVLFFVLLVVFTGFTGEFLRIVHINDFHGHILPEIDRTGREIGGISRIASKIDTILEAYPDTLILDAGDFSSGYLYANFDTGETVLNIYRNIPFTAFTLGNHEFDYGYEHMIRMLEPFKEKIVCANLYQKGKRVYRPYIIKEINGLRVLIMGVTTPEVMRFAVGLDKNNIFISLPQNEVRKILSEAHGKYDVSILISHIGFEDDVKIAYEFSDLDIIIGGHTHTLVKVPPVFNNTIVNQAGSHGEKIGFLRAYYEKGVKDTELRYFSSSLLTPLKSWGEIEKINLMALEAERKVIAISEEILGEATGAFVADKKNVRSGETELGNLICEAILDLSKADFAVMNGGGIRSSLNKGPVNSADVEKVLPFKNNGIVVKLKGKELKENFLNSLQALKVPKLSGAFLQVAGLMVEYDLVNDKVSIADRNGNPIQDDKEYTLAFNDYIKNGGDGYNFRQSIELENYITGKSLKELVAQFIRKKGKISPLKDGRIIIR